MPHTHESWSAVFFCILGDLINSTQETLSFALAVSTTLNLGFRFDGLSHYIRCCKVCQRRLYSMSSTNFWAMNFVKQLIQVLFGFHVEVTADFQETT